MQRDKNLSQPASARNVQFDILALDQPTPLTSEDWSPIYLRQALRDLPN
jgi:hypothetical protein